MRTTIRERTEPRRATCSLRVNPNTSKVEALKNGEVIRTSKESAWQRGSELFVVTATTEDVIPKDDRPELYDFQWVSSSPHVHRRTNMDH